MDMAYTIPVHHMFGWSTSYCRLVQLFRVERENWESGSFGVTLTDATTKFFKPLFLLLKLIRAEFPDSSSLSCGRENFFNKIRNYFPFSKKSPGGLLSMTVKQKVNDIGSSQFDSSQLSSVC